MALTDTNSSQMARDDPENALEFDGAHFHANECTFASPSHNPKCTAYCNGLPASDRDGCGWERTYEDLGTDETGYYVLPPYCPSCYLAGTVSGVRSRRVPPADPDRD